MRGSNLLLTHIHDHHNVANVMVSFDLQAYRGGNGLLFIAQVP